MSQYHYNNNTNSFNKVLNNYTITDHQSRIMTWLSPLEPRLRHQGVQENRVENVGEWLLQTPVFRNWYTGSEGDETDNSVLFCYGDPGVGKTYISSLVIDRLGDQAREQNAIAACFYFDFAAQKEQSLNSMLGALLKQVVSELGETPEDIVRVYEEQKKVIGGRGPQLGDIVKMLQATSSSQRTFICIDALDECAAGYRFRLLDSLKAILQKSTGTRIFVTGRPHIRGEIEERLAGGVAILSIIPRKNDIIEYIRMRLSEDMTPEAMDSSLEAEILRKIPEKVSEIFLLVSLNIEAILRETTVHRRRQKLSEMTDGLGLGDAYNATLGRVKAQGGERARLGMAALMWVSHSERPLHVDELCHALAVEIGSKSLNIKNVPSVRTLLGCCQALIFVDKGASTVRLIHFTLQEFLRTHPDHFLNAHSTIAETCLNYLNSPQVMALSGILGLHKNTGIRAFWRLQWAHIR
ncbi:hypothetical protein L873DRAFT_1819658 [Choiromyces venosus 120613-1]|uniref:Uncharacterized protein n=1 Tax=Choiromyces venosus 120613-1 TaxID=1336337 RepID=A0A3N4IYU0_9PEZI|nr:hypothetical protein L873DRAFT_1819658 [Choiromyces venosus 120613-1]